MLCNIYIYIYNIYRYALLDRYEDSTKLCEDSIWYKRPVCLEVMSKRVFCEPPNFPLGYVSCYFQK